MSDDIQGLSDRLIADPDLRDRFRNDPVGVVKESGIDLSSEQEERLQAEPWLEKTDDELVTQLRGTGLGVWL